MARDQDVLGIGMVGYEFMGRAHSQAWRNVASFFELPRLPRMAAICGRDPERVAAAAARLGWPAWETDWKRLVQHVSILLAIALALVISALIGFVNGFITVFFRVPSFVTTLGTAYMVIGIVLTTSHAYPAPIPEAATPTIRQWFGASDWAHLTWCLLIVVVFHLLLTRTRWGLHTIAVGGNPLGATEAGIRAGRIKIGNFMMVATLGGFAGILDAFRINTIDPNLGGGFGIMFTAVSAAVIGGTALAGGSGTVIGAALGALVLAELQDGMNLIGISANPYFIILGVAILVSMIANVYLSRLRRAGRA